MEAFLLVFYTVCNGKNEQGSGMNKYCYRVIFNRKTGVMTAVSDKAARHAKGAGSSTGCCIAAFVASTACTLRHLAIAIALVCGGLNIVHAQIVTDGQAPAGTQARVTNAGHVPVIQITAPNNAGVSHNQFQQFNVDGQGAVLSNNTAVVNTHLAGAVAANPNLAHTGAASVIVNEVTSTNPTVLKGYLEVAGQRADVVVSNPNGISVGNFGFINTQRGVLTTGKPVFGGQGSLDAFRVTSGNVTVMDNATFNDAATAQVDLIARSVAINGKVWAKNLNVVTGSNTVAYQDLGVTVIAGEKKNPTVAIDVAEVGGMYANKITLIGTEKGVGVHLQGEQVADAGEFVVSAGGDVLLRGVTRSAGSLHVAGNNIKVVQDTYSRKNIAISAIGTLDIGGSIAAQKDITLDSGKTLGMHADVVARGKMDATSGADIVHDKGDINSNDMMTFNAKTSLRNTSHIYAGELTINARAGVINSGSDAIMYSRSKAYVGTDQFTNEKSALFKTDNGAVISGNAEDNSSNTKQIVNSDAIMDIGGSLLLYADAVNNLNSELISATGNGPWVAAEGSGTRFAAGDAEYSSEQASVKDNGNYSYLSITGTDKTFAQYVILNYTSDRQQLAVATTTRPGQIKVQDNLHYYGQNLTNDKSSIQLGGHLLINDKAHADIPDVLHQVDGVGPTLMHDTGTSQYHGIRACGFLGGKTCNDYKSPQAHEGQHYQDSAMHIVEFKEEVKPQVEKVDQAATQALMIPDRPMPGFEAAPALDYYQPLGPLVIPLFEQRYPADKQVHGKDVHVDLDQQYQALMAAGIAFGKTVHLVPGQTLTASQKAALPHDIIWLVSHTVTMPNGQLASVMTPVLFRAR